MLKKFLIKNGYNWCIKLSYGKIDGPYYSQIHPEEEFDTEEAAIEYAHKTNKYIPWLIIPLIRFDYWDEDNEK